MSKLLLQALRRIPKKYIQDETTFAYAEDFVVLANRNLPPIIYKRNDRNWKEITYEKDKK